MLALNPVYLLVVVPALLAWLAQARVRKVYEQYGAIPNRLGVNGLAVASTLLDYLGLSGVTVRETPGHLTDHYDPQSRTLRLSESTARASSVASLGIVAHEVGHAVQDSEGYRPLRLRGDLGRRASQMARWSPLVFIGGMLFRIPILMGLGVLMLIGQAGFALVALPVERDASNRALALLEKTRLVAAGESDGVRKVLRAAAFTYLAGFGQRLSAFLLFVLVVILAGGTWPA